MCVTKVVINYIKTESNHDSQLALKPGKRGYDPAKNKIEIDLITIINMIVN